METSKASLFMVITTKVIMIKKMETSKASMFVIITTKVIIIQKKMETSKARLVRVERTPPTSPPPSTSRSTQRQTLRFIIDFFLMKISNSDIFEARYPQNPNVFRLNRS